RAQHHRAGGTVGRRDHRLLRRAVLHLSASRPRSRASMSALVEFRDVTFGYAAPAGRRARPFRLAPLSVCVEEGEVLGVIGPNSAGKTTLIRLLTRVVHPSSGAILLDGRPLASLSGTMLAREIAVVPQELPQAFPFTVEQLVLMGRYPHAPDRYFDTAA